MRLLKAQNTNLRNIYGKGVKYDVNDQIIMDSTNTVLIPKGTDAERPDNPTNGHMRYNTTLNEFEFYQDGAWRKVRYKEPRTIVQQNLGSGDAVELIFGPLENQDSDFPEPQTAGGSTDILVFVENVFQIYGTNYTIVQNPGGPFVINSIDSIDGVTGFPTITTATAHGLTTGDLVAISGVETSPDDALELLNIGDDSTSPGTVAVTVVDTDTLEIHIDVTGGVPANYIAGTGKVYKAGTSTGGYFPGYYLQFTSAPDLDKPITVLHNFNR